ncbi:hypothetical protein [Sphingobacterium sp.]|nr:hypothetical protein [Sphingobacterium sp.]
MQGLTGSCSSLHPSFSGSDNRHQTLDIRPDPVNPFNSPSKRKKPALLQV